MPRAILIIAVVLFAREADAVQMRLLDVGLRSPLGAFRVDTSPATPTTQSATPNTLRLLPWSFLEGAASFGVSGVISLGLAIPFFLGAAESLTGLLILYPLALIAAITIPFLTSLVVWHMERWGGAGTPNYWTIFFASVAARLLMALLPYVGLFIGPVAGPIAEVIAARLTAVAPAAPPATTVATRQETAPVLSFAF